MKHALVPVVIACALLAAACASSPPPADTSALTPLEMMQRAQERSEVRDWKAAEAWYVATMKQFPDDSAVQASCRYEIAFIAYKKGDYKTASALLEALLADYESPAGDAMPPHILVLTRKVLSTIREKTGS